MVDWLSVRLVDRLIRWDVTPNTVSVAEQDHVYSAVPSRAEDPKIFWNRHFLDGSGSTYHVVKSSDFFL